MANPFDGIWSCTAGSITVVGTKVKRDELLSIDLAICDRQGNAAKLYLKLDQLQSLAGFLQAWASYSKYD
jgi:hypothetical protein